MKTMPSSRGHHYVATVGIFLTMLVALASIAGMVGCGDPGEEAVVFADPDLEAAIRRAIAIPEGPIYPSDLDSLTYLNANAADISDLTGLECCANLTQLDLSSDQISDISALASLGKLTELNLWNNEISDISPLTSLTNLTELVLSINEISDVSPLANLASLIELHLDHNQISDISSLVDNAGLSEGDSVVLSENPLSSDSIDIYIPQLEAGGVTGHY